MEKNNTNDQEVEYVDENDETVNLETDQNCKTGMCVMWNTEVNLEDPMIIRSGKQSEDTEEEVMEFYNTLQFMLYETGFPETEDRTAMPGRANNKENAVVVFLAPPEDCMAMLLECGNQVSDSIHLIFKESWVSKKPSKEKQGLYEIFILKAITFHKGGLTYIDEFNPPRKCTYLVNYFFNAVDSGLPSWGLEMEKNLANPISAPIPLCNQVDDKVWTRYKMSCYGVDHPETLAFTLAPKRYVPSIDTIRVLELGPGMKSKISQTENSLHNKNRGDNANMQNSSNATLESHPEYQTANSVITARHTDANGLVCTHADMELEIRNFLNKPSIINRKIVVKPSGPKHYASVGVSFHPPGNVDSVINAVGILLDKIMDGDSILVETFVEPINPRPVTGISHNIQPTLVDSGLMFRVRCTGCKDIDGKPICSLITCGIGSIREPVHGDNTVPQTLNTTLLAFGVSDPLMRRKIEQDVCKKTEDILQSLIDEEKKMTAEQRGGIGGFTDIIGIDFFLTEKNGQIVPVAVDVNSHDCTASCLKFDCIVDLMDRCTVLNGQILNPVVQQYEHSIGVSSDNSSQYKRRDLDMPKFDELFGRSVRPWVRTMLTRSQDYLLQDKTILVIGAGGYSNQFIWPSALELGVNIVLVDSNLEYFARDLVYRFISIDIEDHKRDRAHASFIVETLRDMNISVDGCLTFWDDCGPLAALVSELLKTKGNTYKAAYMAKTKSLTQAHLRKRTGPIPHWQYTSLFACRSARITCEADIPKAIQAVSIPAILKLEHASCAVGVNIVKCKEDVFNQYANITNRLRTNVDFRGVGLGFSNLMVLMEHLQGSDHVVDVVIFERKLVAAFITNNGLTNWPSYIETSALMPSNLTVDKQAQLVNAAFQCLTELGLSNGVFNVRMQLTSIGPKLIDINARTGGLYICDWVKRLYRIDLMKCALLVSCGIRPYIPLIPPSEYILGVMLMPSKHKHVMHDKVTRMILDDMQSQGDIILTLLETEESLRFANDKAEYEQPYANIAVQAQTVEEARRKLLNICKKLAIETSDYKVSQFIQLC
ncbi:carnosine synthase 1-like isoform X2 [Dreissena polymorpha]|nr:carnosine synthase 1-like isoform X2 [Dreissena polymorpha]